MGLLYNVHSGSFRVRNLIVSWKTTSTGINKRRGLEICHAPFGSTEEALTPFTLLAALTDRINGYVFPEEWFWLYLALLHLASDILITSQSGHGYARNILLILGLLSWNWNPMFPFDGEPVGTQGPPVELEMCIMPVRRCPRCWNVSASQPTKLETSAVR